MLGFNITTFDKSRDVIYKARRHEEGAKTGLQNGPIRGVNTVSNTSSQGYQAIAANLNRLTERLRTDMNSHLLPPVKAIKLGDDVSSKQAERERAFTLRDYTPENRAEIDLGEINVKCGEVAGDLISILRMFKAEGKNNEWKSFRMALKTVWDEDQIQKAVSKLTVQESTRH
jgi:hypothetical protein